jgi:site-specific DNA-methyltransferase (adenine-specific)
MFDKIFHGDCLQLIKEMTPGLAVDMVLTDLPYGTTANPWDAIIPFDEMWKVLEEVCKPNAAIVLTASQPFTSKLVMSKTDWFRHEWIWEKNTGSNYLNLKYSPFKKHENVLVFAKNGGYTYNPQPDQVSSSKKRFAKITINRMSDSTNYGADSSKKKPTIKMEGENPPSSVQFFSLDDKTENIHPTQKPVALFEYLIKTYSNEGDSILDLTAGSCTTAVAAYNLNRHYTCFEKDPMYYKLAVDRIKSHEQKFSRGHVLRKKGLEEFF